MPLPDRGLTSTPEGSGKGRYCTPYSEPSESGEVHLRGYGSGFSDFGPEQRPRRECELAAIGRGKISNLPSRVNFLDSGRFSCETVDLRGRRARSVPPERSGDGLPAPTFIPPDRARRREPASEREPHGLHDAYWDRVARGRSALMARSGKAWLLVPWLIVQHFPAFSTGKTGSLHESSLHTLAEDR